jgi:hypothetical protein
MGVCSYGGGTIPAHSKQFCEDNDGVWSEGTAEEKGFQGNWLIGKDFGTAVANTLNPDSPETEEDLKGYFTRRIDEDPAGLAMDAALYGFGGGYAALGRFGLGALLKKGLFKKINKTKFKKPEIVNGRIVKGSKYGKVTTEVTRPRYGVWGAAGVGLPLADRLGYTSPFNTQPFSAAGKESRLAMQQKALETSKAGIDAVNTKKDVEAEATAKAQAEQDRIDNMSFFDKWKLGMKDPSTAALFGAGLQDIGSNIPGQNTLAELQGDYATAAASGGPNAADFNATKVSDSVLKDRFMKGSSIFKIGDSETRRKANAAEMVSMYRAVQAKLYAAGMRTDDEYVMQVLRAQAQGA